MPNAVWRAMRYPDRPGPLSGPAEAKIVIVKGMSLAEIARMLGGDIQVRSEPGKGSTFLVTLPVRKLPPENPENPEVPPVEREEGGAAPPPYFCNHT